MPSPIFKAVKTARDLVSSDLANASAYLAKAITEKQAVQQNVNILQAKLAIYDAWILANPDV